MDNNNVNKLTNKKEIMRDELAIKLMEKLDKKYNMSNIIDNSKNSSIVISPANTAS